jgi:hypothetical protein
MSKKCKVELIPNRKIITIDQRFIVAHILFFLVKGVREICDIAVATMIDAG